MLGSRRVKHQNEATLYTGLTCPTDAQTHISMKRFQGNWKSQGSSVIECLPSMCDVLGQSSALPKRRKV